MSDVADDTKILNPISNDADSIKLQEDLDYLSDWSKKWQLRFNTSKCKVLHMGRLNSNEQYHLQDSTDNNILETTTLEKDLGIHIDPELKFSKHTELQVNKANRILAMIRRSYTHLDKESLKKLFCALVRPHLEYSVVAWSPCLEKDKKLIESVLHRATRLLAELRDLDYEQRLSLMDIPSMAYRRVRGDMIEVWKYLHEKYEANHHFFSLDKSNTRGHSLKLKKPRCNKSVRQHFFTYRVVTTWNSLPEAVISAPTINSFKNRLDITWSDHKFTEKLHFPLPTNEVNEEDLNNDENEEQLIGN